MRRALVLARRGRTSPNPMVGAVVVKDGAIVGEGCHRRAGDAHAEVVALQKAGDSARGATLYVSLEPCCHFGQTPPCTKALIAAGVEAVVAAMVDPNPKVSGLGLAELESARIKTAVGVLADEARKLNEAYIKFITTGLPFVTLKLAMTLDGKIATRTGDSRWVSCEESRRLVHKLRDRADAVLVGVGTVIVDDPELTARIGRRVSYPLRIVADSLARTPPASKVLAHHDVVAGRRAGLQARTGEAQETGRTIIAVTPAAPKENVRKLEQAGARIISVGEAGRHVNLRALVRELGRMDVASLLIEGGGRIAASALSEGIVDKLMLFVAPKVAGGESAVTAVEGTGVASMADALRFGRMTVRKVGGDLLIEAYPCSQG